MKIVGVYNIKGGVGKTSTAVNMAYLAAEEGRRTLIWDLDPQAAASYYFRVKAKVKGGGKALVKQRRDLDSAVKGTDFENLDLLPADFSYRNMDLLLEDTKQPKRRFTRMMKPLSDEYDLVILDCPPSISLMSENVFHAADALLVPMIPTTLSARTLLQLHDFLEGESELKKLKLMPFFSMVDKRKKLHTELMTNLPETYPELLSTSIPYASDVERMGVHRMPLPAYAPTSAAAKAYRALWDEAKQGL